MIVQLSLLPPVPRVIGPLEAALVETLDDWATRGYLTGAENSARRRMLSELAALADAATAAAHRGERTEATAARCVVMYAQTLDAYTPPPVEASDPHADTVRSAALAILADMTADDAAR